MSSPRESTHAIASCATLAPLAAAIARSSSTSARLRLRLASVKRGACARKSPGSSSRSAEKCPLMSPRLSTPYAVIAIPSSRHVGRISRSIPRETTEYSICRSQIGCVAAARRNVSSPTSERPMWRT